MIVPQTESKAQRWRAIAKFPDAIAALICVGASITHIRELYVSAFLSKDALWDEEQRSRCKEIILEQWRGIPDRGYWVQSGTLPIPKPKKKAEVAA